MNSEHSRIDASIDKQIAILFSHLVGGQRCGERTVNNVGPEGGQTGGGSDAE